MDSLQIMHCPKCNSELIRYKGIGKVCDKCRVIVGTANELGVKQGDIIRGMDGVLKPYMASKEFINYK